MKQLITMTLGGIVGLCLLAGDAEACHKRKCGGGCGQVVAYQTASCAPRAKKCGHGGLGHKKRTCATCAGPVLACNTGYVYGGGYSYSGYAYGAPMASGQYMGSPQTTRSMTSPQAPGKSMGTPQR